MTSTWKNVVRGVAIGDAWGDPVEFRKIAKIVRTNVRGPDLPDRLRITDDTQMTLYLADALDQTLINFTVTHGWGSGFRIGCGFATPAAPQGRRL